MGFLHDPVEEEEPAQQIWTYKMSPCAHPGAAWCHQALAVVQVQHLPPVLLPAHKAPDSSDFLKHFFLI